MLLGKTHMSEFAYRVHHPGLGWVRNPHDLTRASGGSSSGSAAAVAAGIAPVAIGTDTGGSARIPAAYCGIVGYKGSQGLVSVQGVVPLSPTMDHVAVLARSVGDAALVYQEMASSYLELIPPGEAAVPPAEARQLRVGLERGYLLAGAQRAVLDCWSDAVARLGAAGCQISEIRLPDAKRWRSMHRTILLSEAWRFHARRVLAGEPYGPLFRAAIGEAKRISPESYQAALEVRLRAAEAMAATFCDIDVLLTPTCPTVAPMIEEGRRGTGYTRYTTLAAFTGLPAISVPAPVAPGRLPVGLQLIGPPRRDDIVVRAAALLERLLAGSPPEPRANQEPLTRRAPSGFPGPITWPRPAHGARPSSRASHCRGPEQRPQSRRCTRS